MQLTPDNRILIGGGYYPLDYGSQLSSGNHKPSLQMLEDDLFSIRPQLRGINIAHGWSSMVCTTMDRLPSIGTMGDARNIYYSLGYSGEGVNLSQVADKILSELYSGDVSELVSSSLVNRSLGYIPPEPFKSTGVAFFKKNILNRMLTESTLCPITEGFSKPRSMPKIKNH